MLVKYCPKCNKIFLATLAKGGLHHPDNLQIVVKKYNLEKGSKLNFRLPLNTEVYKWVYNENK